MFRRLVLIALGLVLSGCMFFESPADRKIRQQPDFRLGYDDGCATATDQGANMRRGDLVRDEALYETDKAYRAGWASGHSGCMRMAPTGQANGPLSDPIPGSGH